MKQRITDLRRLRRERDEAFRLLKQRRSELGIATGNYQHAKEVRERRADELNGQLLGATRSIAENRRLQYKMYGKARSVASRSMRRSQKSINVIRRKVQECETEVARMQEKYERARQLYMQAKIDYQKKETAHMHYLNDMKVEAAARANVPFEYREATKLVDKRDGTLHFYYGGEKLPDGPGHAHHVLQPDREGYFARHLNEPFGKWYGPSQSS